MAEGYGTSGNQGVGHPETSQNRRALRDLLLGIDKRSTQLAIAFVIFSIVLPLVPSAAERTGVVLGVGFWVFVFWINIIAALVAIWLVVRVHRGLGVCVFAILLALGLYGWHTAEPIGTRPSLMFSRDAAFSSARQASIVNILGHYMDYLSGLGFDVRTVLPPLSVANIEVACGSVVSNPSDDILGAFQVCRNPARDKETIPLMFNVHLFHKQLGVTLDPPTKANNNKLFAAFIIDRYFSSSYLVS
jgi:hypothetical protein